MASAVGVPISRGSKRPSNATPSVTPASFQSVGSGVGIVVGFGEGAGEGSGVGLWLGIGVGLCDGAGVGLYIGLKAVGARLCCFVTLVHTRQTSIW